VYDKSIIIITADHGEEFLEHGNYGHGKTLYDEVIRIPLIIHTPKSKDKILVEKQTESIEIARYILNLTGTDWRAISSLKFKENTRYEDMSFASLHQSQKEMVNMSSVRTPEYTYIYNLESNNAVLFKSSDKEEKNVISENPKVINEMVDFVNWVTGLDSITSEKANMSEETKSQLKALGYIN